MFRRNARLQKRVKSHLIPRQTSYLNTRTRPSPRLNGPIYRIMAGRARAYKRGSRRKNRKALNYRLKSRMVKFNWKFQFKPRRYKTFIQAKNFRKVRNGSRECTSLIPRIDRRVMVVMYSDDRRNRGRYRKGRRLSLLKQITTIKPNTYRKSRRRKRVSKM
jgi:hypothetical protein